MNDIKTIDIHGKAYVPVSERVRVAHEESKKLSITTEVLPNGGSIVIKATVTTEKGVFTGISAANPAKAIEKMSPYEVAETSAIGRALGFAGFGIIEGIATADEVVKAQNDEEPPLIDPDEPNDTARTCTQHDEVMIKAYSKTKKKDYWSHRNDEGQICFGSGYLE
jgi:hypothetical protein